ncbi:MAG: hypothetical protein VW522_12660 [Candidatus Neomarinimicrobiota bacterium]|jgi:hypothetical protein|nr:hypothetical protein [Flavobacteriaceae bacterium]RCL67977.1 MAG: hypothetical protein DBW77_01070 [Cryomorphaceae bacterium]
MKNTIYTLLLAFTFTSCGFDVQPNVEVKNNINLTIDGENIDGVQGEWTITSEEKKDDGKEIFVITIKKVELE